MAAMAAIHVLARMPGLVIEATFLIQLSRVEAIFLRQKLLFRIADRFSSFGQLARSQFAPNFLSLVVAFVVGAATSWTGKRYCQKLRQQSQIKRN